MIKTVDGLTVKKGSRVWEIGCVADRITPDSKPSYVPTLSIVHGGKNAVINPDRCWASYARCLLECHKLNNPMLIITI